MIKTIKNIIKNPLFSGSAVMIIGSNMANVIAYIYHFIVGRLLGPSAYGELAAVLSVLGLLFTAFNFLGLVIVKFVSSAPEKEIYPIIYWFTSKLLRIAIVLGLIMLLATPLISGFLKIGMNTTFLIAPIVFMAFLAFIYRSFAQGLMKFMAVVISTNIDMLLRLTVGIIMIYLGFSVFGTVLGLVVSMTVSYFYLKRYIDLNVKKTNFKHNVEFGGKVIKYSLPILVATLTTNSMFTTDVILVKHYFPSHEAGIYASLSTLGKIIFYGTGPVSAVMFPLIARKYSKKQSSGKIFMLSLVLTVLMSVAVLVIYKFFPVISIKMLFGGSYTEGANHLLQFGIFMSIFATASLIFNYFLSIEKTKVVIFSAVTSILQIIGIVIWHSNINEVIDVSIYSSLLLLFALSAYYLYYTRKNAGSI